MINIGDISKPSVSRSEVKSKSKNSGSKVGQASPIESTSKVTPEKKKQRDDANDEYQSDNQSGSATKKIPKIEEDSDLTYDKKGQTKSNTHVDFKV